MSGARPLGSLAWVIALAPAPTGSTLDFCGKEGAVDLTLRLVRWDAGLNDSSVVQGRVRAILVHFG